MYISLVNAVGRMNGNDGVDYMQKLRCTAGCWGALNDIRTKQAIEKANAALASFVPCFREMDSRVKAAQSALLQLTLSPEFQAAHAKLKSMQLVFQQLMQKPEIQLVMPRLQSIGLGLQQTLQSQEAQTALRGMAALADNLPRITLMPGMQFGRGFEDSEKNSKSLIDLLEHDRIPRRTTETEITTQVKTSEQELKSAVDLAALPSSVLIKEVLSRELRQGKDGCANFYSRGQAAVSLFFSLSIIYSIDRQLSIYAQFIPAYVVALWKLAPFIPEIIEIIRELLDDVGRLSTLAGIYLCHLKSNDNQI